MLSAAIDVGSNTIRTLIGRIRGNEISRIYTDRVITRLAAGISETGRLNKVSIIKSLSVLKNFSDVISKYNAGNVRAVGTSAIREAENSKEFIDAVFKETGINIDIISGTEEAELTAKGVMLGFREIRTPTLIIDIGGGSTEWIIHNPETSGGTLLSGTIPIGAVKLYERFIKTDPPSQDDISALYNEIGLSLEQKMLNQVQHDMKQIRNLIGTGGTITTIASLDLELVEYDHEKIHMRTISIEKLYRIKDMLISLPLKDRMDIKGLEPERADLIIPGIMLTIRLLEILGCSEITVSDYGLLEGILKEIDDEKGF